MSRTINEYCHNGNIKMVKQEIEKGYDIKNDPEGILHIAVSRNNYSMTEFLIENGANINIKNDKGDNLLHIASIIPIDYDLLKLLIDNGINIDERDNRGATPLCKFSSPGYFDKQHIKSINYLLDKGADPFIFDRGYGGNGGNGGESCPMFNFCMKNLVDVLKKINLDENNINIASPIGRNSLHIACKRGAWRVAKYLIEKGIDKSIRDVYGNSAHDLAIGQIGRGYQRGFDHNDEHDEDIVNELFPPAGDKTKSAS